LGERIVLGFGDNTDYEIEWDGAVLERLVDEHRVSAAELGADGPIGGIHDLLVSILGFLRSGSGGERFVESTRIVEDFAGRFRCNVTIGGTSPRAAIAMRRLGVASALHLVTVNDHVRRLIPPDCPWVCSNGRDSVHPHLIVQFPAGGCVRAGDIAIRTRSADRIIYSNDPDNIAMEISPDFGALATDARVLLVSGFNAMHSSALLADRLGKVRRIIRALPPGALVFFEDAGFYNPLLSMQVRAALVDAIDVYSLNEDELQGHLGRKISLLDPRDVHAALLEMQRLVPVPALVVHARHWALAFGAQADRHAAALRGGIAMATTRLRLGDEFSAADYQRTSALPADGPGARFATAIRALAGDRVCCVPSLRVADGRVTTVGLGDAFVGGFLPLLAGEEQGAIRRSVR